MALTANKYILPDGNPLNGTQITQSSTIGPSDLWDFGAYNYVHSGNQNIDGGSGFGGYFFSDPQDVRNNDNGNGSFVSSPDLGPSDLWNTVTNRFDFSDLSVGDMVDIHIELEIDPSTTNSIFDLWLEMGLGGTQRIVKFLHFKSSENSVYTTSSYKGIFMSDSSDITNPARFRCAADQDVQIQECRFYCKLIRKGR